MDKDNKRPGTYRMHVYPIDVDTEEMEWVAEIPDLPGCIGCGDMPEEAIVSVKEAQKAWIEVALKEGKKVPLPTNPFDTEYSGKFTLRIPKTLHKELVIKSQEEGVSLNQYLIYLISKGIGEEDQLVPSSDNIVDIKYSIPVDAPQWKRDNYNRWGGLMYVWEKDYRYFAD